MNKELVDELMEIIYYGDWNVEPDEWYLNNETQVAEKIVEAVLQHLNMKDEKWVQDA